MPVSGESGGLITINRRHNHVIRGLLRLLGADSQAGGVVLPFPPLFLTPLHMAWGEGVLSCGEKSSDFLHTAALGVILLPGVLYGANVGGSCGDCCWVGVVVRSGGVVWCEADQDDSVSDRDQPMRGVPTPSPLSSVGFCNSFRNYPTGVG